MKRRRNLLPEKPEQEAPLLSALSTHVRHAGKTVVLGSDFSATSALIAHSALSHGHLRLLRTNIIIIAAANLSQHDASLGKYAACPELLPRVVEAGVELRPLESQVRRANHYTTESPVVYTVIAPIIIG